MHKTTLLLEIGTEEIPARFMNPALKQLRENATEELQAENLEYKEIRAVGTPRRLTLLVAGLAPRQKDIKEKKKGPSAKAAFGQDGLPTKAAQGFARAQGVTVEALFTEVVDGVEYVFALREEPGQSAQKILPAFCERLIKRLSFPKPMFWYNKEIRFARPIRWLTALYGREVVPFQFAGLESDRKTYGHRFLSPSAITLTSADDYIPQMAAHAVIVDPETRLRMITEQVNSEATVLGGHSTLDVNLLEEVTYLVEFPKAVAGNFASDYLELPHEVLVTVMRAHQRYFPVYDREEKLMPHFITVSNGVRDGFLSNVRSGNEKVLKARLADARFFFEEDRKKPLQAYTDDLANIVFMDSLGSMLAKSERLIRLTGILCAELDLSKEDTADASRAALLAKADLSTHMVYEFPELQGFMGRHYALLSGEKETVASAIAEHYSPRSAGDRIPASLIGAIVAVADKLDTLAACFGLGLIPSGSQDPYALRRSAQGIVSILQAYPFSCSLRELVRAGLVPLAGKLSRLDEEVQADVYDFIMQRIRSQFSENGFRYDVIDAVLSGEDDSLRGLTARANVLQDRLDTPELNRILTPFTRAANLAGQFTGGDVNREYFSMEAEYILYQALREAEESVQQSAANGDFEAMFRALSPLHSHIDRFFTDVMVMVNDERVRNNRLSLLRQVKELFLTLGDLSKIVAEKK